MQTIGNRVELIARYRYINELLYSCSLEIGKTFGVVLPGSRDQKRGADGK